MVEQGRLLPVLVGIVANHVQHDHGAVLADFCRFLQRLISHKRKESRVSTMQLKSSKSSLRADSVVALDVTEPTELDIQSKITEAGYLRIMTMGLDVHPQSQRLYIEVCRLVALLCFDTVATPHADNQVDIADSGLFTAICERLQSACISEEEAAAGYAAISALAYENGVSVLDL
ncbi:unnamed protein product [Phytophthora fragariaefolia]|uniref:Unnamed protein product n=1 Tax=Phytophthora fragariaefolia TaxID=1490495 RepID=A0A9W7D833_9STRA|nr:unnamed protein product [Phytophthora fragariaefolia]